MKEEKRKKRGYTEDFKNEAVRLVASGERRISELSKNLGIRPSTLSTWVKAAEKEHSREKRENGAKLRDELRRLRIETDILKKALGFFAKNPM